MQAVRYAVAAGMVALSGAAWGASYQAVELLPSGGYGNAWARAIDGTNVGGWAWAAGITPVGIAWTGGTPSPLLAANSGTQSYVTGVAGTSLVGSNASKVTFPGSTLEVKGNPHALLWTDVTHSHVATDLHDTDWFEWSIALGVSGNTQVGVANVYEDSSQLFVNQHAVQWTGTAASWTDLHPGSITQGATTTDFISSAAWAIAGSAIAGEATAVAGVKHAVLWTAGGAVDLNQDAIHDGAAFGVHGAQQVGYQDVETPSGVRAHAFLWSSAAAGAIDLTPASLNIAYATAVSGGLQVGYGSALDGEDHALAWTGTAQSMVDLQSFLSDMYTSSKALGVDANGWIVGYANQGGPGGDGLDHAIVWQPVAVPEPGTLGMGAVGLGLGALSMLLRRRRR